LPISYFDSALLGNQVDGEKSYVVRRELILLARISQPDNQLHAFSISTQPAE
jgi:hypothetical protein